MAAMSLDVKICGLSTPETVRAALDAGATHIGFIFFHKSPRNVLPEAAAPLADMAARHGVKSVAVTVNADDETLDHIVNVARPSMLQLHGNEAPERVAELKAGYGLPVMKAIAIRDASDIGKIEPYIGVADRFLLDAKPPKGSDLPGGNAVSFDWSLLEKVRPDIDYLLAGGIDVGNVADALACNPPGLDISSGVESAPGVKDIGLIGAFFDAIKAHTEKRVSSPARS